MAENLIANVEGDIAEVDGVLKITQIRLRYQLTVPDDKRSVVDRILELYSEKCPAYQSIKGCIECSWEMEIREG